MKAITIHFSILNLFGRIGPFLQALCLFTTIGFSVVDRDMAEAATGVFSFHVVDEPSQIRPQFSDRFTGKYLVGNLFTGFFKIDEKNKLVPQLAESCDWKSNTRLVCKMRTSKWSNGETFGAREVHEHMVRILSRDQLNSSSEMMLGLKNYRSYLAGKAEWTSVGLKHIPPHLVQFDLEAPDRDFLFRLSHPAFSPLPEGVSDKVAGQQYATGPYYLKEWKRGRSLVLAPTGGEPRPLVEVFFIAEDTTALNLFEKGKLKLLRRMPPESVRRFTNDPRLQYISFLRFDYIGIGKSVDDETLRDLDLGSAFDFKEFQKVFLSLGRPGCVGLPNDWQEQVHCLDFNPKKKREESPPLNLYFASQGGDEMFRTMQWFQGQYKKNRGGFLNLHQEDYKMLTARLRKSPPDLFRRGYPIDRPTCLAALESFQSSSPDNFLGFRHKKYDENLLLMKDPKKPQKELKKLCAQSIKWLIDSGRVIPLGQIHVPILASADFTGWTINGLNQLDLSELRHGPSK